MSHVVQRRIYRGDLRLKPSESIVIDHNSREATVDEEEVDDGGGCAVDEVLVSERRSGSVRLRQVISTSLFVAD